MSRQKHRKAERQKDNIIFMFSQHCQNFMSRHHLQALCLRGILLHLSALEYVFSWIDINDQNIKTWHQLIQENILKWCSWWWQFFLKVVAAKSVLPLNIPQEDTKVTVFFIIIVKIFDYKWWSWWGGVQRRAVECCCWWWAGKKDMSSWTPILRHCVCYPKLTEPLDIDKIEEYGQKRKCPPGPLFWGTVCPNLT